MHGCWAHYSDQLTRIIYTWAYPWRFVKSYHQCNCLWIYTCFLFMWDFSSRSRFDLSIKLLASDHRPQIWTLSISTLCAEWIVQAWPASHWSAITTHSKYSRWDLGHRGEIRRDGCVRIFLVVCSQGVKTGPPSPCQAGLPRWTQPTKHKHCLVSLRVRAALGIVRFFP